MDYVTDTNMVQLLIAHKRFLTLCTI